MQGSVVFNGDTSEPFQMKRGVRQGCVLAPTLFGIFFSVLLKIAFRETNQGILIHTRSDGKLFNIIQLLKSKRYRQEKFVDTLLFADDAAFVASTPDELQTIVDKFAAACSMFNMSINAKKTVILAQGCTDIPTILLNGAALNVVDSFCYLGSVVSSNLALDSEIGTRIGKAATMFGKLSTRVWNNKHLTIKTKMTVYQTCILSILLYGAETWTSYAKQERRLNTFHMRCLRNILGITWKDRVTNETVLETAQLPSITGLLKQRRLRWLGHVHRMKPSRLPRQILLSEIAHARRPVGRPMLRYKDSVKRDMSSFNIEIAGWEQAAENRNNWRKLCADGVAVHDRAWLDNLAAKRTARHQRQNLPPTISNNRRFTCQKCDRTCGSRIGLFSHERRCIN